MAEHTPGPWAMDEKTWAVLCPQAGLEDAFPEVHGVICRPGYRPNARLIAAAPDLLKAAKRALAVLKAQGESVRAGAVTGALADAIAKSEPR